MKPGREMDALVAEKVMGWNVVEFQGRKVWAHQDHKPAIELKAGEEIPDLFSELPNYSTAFNAAFTVASWLPS